MSYRTTLLCSAIALSPALAAQGQDAGARPATDLDASQGVGIAAGLEIARLPRHRHRSCRSDHRR
ncbi:hypothetical protein GGR61_001536 [Xanthomonas arboricola]|nr:hypothetical protein [Xanthomonas sp. 3075]MBB5863921.1 hypothetical protein [Xanthomonas sp. 3058]